MLDRKLFNLDIYNLFPILFSFKSHLFTLYFQIAINAFNNSRFNNNIIIFFYFSEPKL